MTPDELKEQITEGFRAALATKNGLNARLEDGKPATSLKEYTECLKAAADWFTRLQEKPQEEYGKALRGVVNGR